MSDAVSASRLKTLLYVGDGMKESELIARQAKQLEELRDEVADLKERARRARLHIYCIGGPLNDNKLRYSKQQMVTFWQIADELGNV